MQREEDQGFTVSDRRGGTRQHVEPTAPPPQPPNAAGAVEAESEAHRDSMGPPDFSGLLLSLASTALMHLGASPPDGTASPVNLPRAQEMIDLLGVLEAKTKGNLTPDESALLTNILYTLRLRYVEHAR
jgi:hypothetical protein